MEIQQVAGAPLPPAHRPAGPLSIPASSTVHWAELDLFRGLACVCMILNHMTTTSPAIATSRLIQASAFVGSFAPVFFFFATGLGYGVQSTRPGKRQGYGFLVKVAVLVAADLDFFTFIGLSMLVLELIRRLPRGGPVVAASVGLVALLARFVAGPLLKPMLAAVPWRLWAGDFLGTGGHFGYPAGPWLAYPMFGYVLGSLASANRDWIASWRRLPSALFVLALPFALGCLVMVARGHSLNRFVTMQTAYFLASFAALAAGFSAVVWLTRAPWARRFVDLGSLGGLRSFAVVPLHYLLLNLASAILGPPVGPGTFAATSSAVLVLSFVGSSLFIRLASLLDRPRSRVAVALAVVALAVTYYTAYRGDPGNLASAVVLSIYQLFLCIVLSFRLKAVARG